MAIYPPSSYVRNVEICSVDWVELCITGENRMNTGPEKRRKLFTGICTYSSKAQMAQDLGRVKDHLYIYYQSNVSTIICAMAVS